MIIHIANAFEVYADIHNINHLLLIYHTISPSSVFDEIPSNCSRAEFKAFIPANTGVQSIWFGHPMICPPAELNRPVWVLLDSPEAALHLVNALDGHKVTYLSDFRRHENSTLTLHCKVLQPPRHSHTLPAIANTPKRIAADLTALTNLLVAFEHYWEIESSLVPCMTMLSQQVSDLTDVDRIYVLVHALRRIFGYDYWHSKDDQEFGISFHVGGLNISILIDA